MEEQIIELINSGVNSNIELAFILLEGQGINKIEFINKYYKDLLILCDLKVNEINIQKLFEVTFIGKKILSVNLKIPENIGWLKKLETLHLYGYILELPISIKQIPNLKTIMISSNYLKNIEGLKELIQLENLVLEDTNIKEIPEWIGNLVNLKSLSFNHSKIKRLPKTLVNLKKLETLILINNKFVSIPRILKELPNLKTLKMGDNKIKYIPEFINNLESFSVNCGTKFNKLKYEIRETLANNDYFLIK